MLIDTKDILFICGGAFVDLEKTISERRQDSSIGFGAPVRANMRSGLITNAAVASSWLESVESSDVIAYGLIPEFVGLFPILVNLSAVTEDQLVQDEQCCENKLKMSFTFCQFDSENETAASDSKAIKETINFKEIKRVDHIFASMQRTLPPVPPPPPFPEGYAPPSTAEGEKSSENQQVEPQQPSVDPIIDQGPSKRMKL